MPIYNGMLCYSLKINSSEKNLFDPIAEKYMSAYDKENDLIYHFHLKPGRLAYNPGYENIPYLNKIKAGDTVIACMGECDVRLHLYRFNSTEEIVEAYVRNTAEYFAENKLFFLTPLPPLNETIFLSSAKRGNYYSPPEERIKEQTTFVTTLNRVCSELDLPEPIDIGFGSYFLGSTHRSEDKLHVNTFYCKKIAKTILNRKDIQP
jgi:hypothetical protein